MKRGTVGGAVPAGGRGAGCEKKLVPNKNNLNE
jgi:hypothetical protein